MRKILDKIFVSRKLSILICLSMILLLSSCEIVSNYITTGGLYTAEIDGSMYIQSSFSQIYKVDMENKTFSLVENSELNDFGWKAENELKYQYFAGEYQTTIPDGYDGVAKYIEGCELDNKNSVVDACGYVTDGILTGFIQVYKDTSGVHGNYAIEKIAHSIFFSYSAETDEFSSIKKFDDVVAVAFQGDVAIYWKDKAYYAYDLETDKETYLVEDKAYDSGISQLSTPAVFFNEEMCIFHLVKGKTNENIEYMYVYDFSIDEFFDLKQQE